MRSHDRSRESERAPARGPAGCSGARSCRVQRLLSDPWGAALRQGGRALLALLVVTTVGCFSEHRSPLDVDPGLTCADVPPEGRTGPEPVVVIRDFAFHPEEISVSEGTTVTWINCEGAGTVAHTTTSDTGAWDSGLLGPGGADVFTRTFDEAGTSSYHCTPHPFMTGRVVVGS